MDFNLLTRQRCIAAAYVSKPVKLATLANAVAQCDASVGKRRDPTKKAKAPPAPLESRLPPKT
jgi:hypothetical protein